MHDIVEVKAVKDHIIYLRFENGVEGEVDLSNAIPFEGIFAKLEDPNYFATVRVNTELGTIVWDNGADLSPAFLYSILSKKAA